METVHLLISGKVQGVFFRQTAVEMAERLNVKGWIKNTSDSRVEALITGRVDDIKSFMDKNQFVLLVNNSLLKALVQVYIS